MKRSVIITVAVFILIAVLFIPSVTAVSEGNIRRRRESLELALGRAVTTCFAWEGRYPPSIEYLEENYSLTYDKDRFYIGYTVLGTNIRPDYTIIEK